MAKQPEKRTTKVVAEGAASGKDAPRQPAPEPEPPPEAEPQASPEPEPAIDKLLAAANAASGPARNAWLAFLVLLAYLLITLAGVTHKDLLLNSPIRLPIINVDIPLFSFFVAAPFLFVLVHLGLLVQHAIVAHKYQHFSKAIAVSEEGQAGDHLDRQLVNNYVFSQMLAGPKPPWPLQMLMRLMVFVTLSLLPVLVLLYFQIKFLPSHDVAITHAHRIAILLDLALLFIVRPFIAMPYLRPHGKILSLGNQSWRWEMSYLSLGIAVGLVLVIYVFSHLIATIPGEATDRMMARLPASVVTDRGGRRVFTPTRWLFEGAPDRVSGKPTSWFGRNIVVTDTDLVPDRDDPAGEVSISLRGRDLRFAVLDRSDLHRADLTGSDLSGATARGIRLEKAKLQDADLQGADLGQAKLKSANLIDAKLQGANLREAKLQGANLVGAQLQGATLVGAQLYGALLITANLQGAFLMRARLQGADLQFAELQGASLGATDLQGANLVGVGIWQASHPGEPGLLHLANFRRAHASPLGDSARRTLKDRIANAVQNAELRDRVLERLKPLLTTPPPEWTDQQAWTETIKNLTAPPADGLGAFLKGLVCGDLDGHVARGIGDQVIGNRPPAVQSAFATALLDEPKEKCAGRAHLSGEVIAELKSLKLKTP